MDRYRELLEDYYYRSDHIDVDWEEAQEDLCRHSAYRDLDADDRKKLFDEHMAILKDKMEKKVRGLD